MMAPASAAAAGVGARRNGTATGAPSLAVRALTIGAGVVVAILGVALIVALTCAGAARDALGLTFPGLPRTLPSAAHVFVANARLLLVTVIAAAVASQLAPRGEAGRVERWAGRVPVAICDLALALGCAVQVLLVGAALGGYGTRTLAYILPHGPVELAGFATGLALYVEARRGRLTLRAAVRPIVMAIVLLAVAAGLEVFTGA